MKTMFSYSELENAISPFLLLDYAGPADFEPTTTPRGVGAHPHRGFETVTIVYQGDVEHRDNAGNTGKIGPGDVQWMTAGKGILHEEMHGRELTEMGGTLEMVQLWVNLPAKYKMSSPKYQDILNEDIPVVSLNHAAGRVRIISGEFHHVQGPAQTFTPIHLWDVQMNKASHLELPLRPGFTTAILVLNGRALVNEQTELSASQLVLFEREGNAVLLETRESANFLVLHGEPIDEPIVGQGPFVMNTQKEIIQAVTDFQEGRF